MKMSIIEKIVVWLLIATWLLISIFLHSRSLLIGSATILLISLYHQKPGISQLLKLHQLVVFLSITLIILICFFKSDSSRGRMFIYKVSLPMWRDGGLKGIGLGTFQEKYMHYQHTYFLNKTNADINELLLADNTYYLFNDYLQFILEAGIIGALLVCLFWIIMIKTYISFCSYKKSAMQHIFLVILTPVIIAAFFNHFFEKIWVQLMFCSLLPLLIYDEINILRDKNTFCIMLYALLFSTFFVINKDKFLFYRSYEQITEAQTLASCGYTTESLKILDHTDIAVRKSVKYNLTYGTLLLKIEQYDRAIPYLIRTVKNFPSSELYVLLAICLKNQKCYNVAENHLIMASLMTPNRFSPRQELLSLYITQNKTQLAKNEAAKILRLPVKVRSKRVEDIRSIARNYLRL